MAKLIPSKIVIFLLSLTRSVFSENVGSVGIPVKRSYQLPILTAENNPQQLQYYPQAASLFTAVPAVLIPNQISLSAPSVPNVVLPSSASESKQSQEYQETSTSGYVNQKFNRIYNHLYKPKQRSHGYVQGVKRPSSYINSIYGHPVRMKPLSSIPPQHQKVSSLTIQPSIDLSGQYSQESASSLYPSTVGPPVGSTYGPAKAVDFQHKSRLSGQSVYHRIKGGPPHRHPFYPSKKMRVYSHVHKDHVHNHYLPPKYSSVVYKPHQSSKYAGPTYLPPVSSTQSSHLETRPETPVHSYQTSNHVRFPNNIELPVNDHQDFHKPNNSPGDVTQAIIKTPGVINNYDASIPLQVPSKKPYQFEVNEILKNSDLHFVRENENENNDFSNVQNNALLQKIPYQNPLVFNQPIYTMEQSNVITASNPLDIYNLPAYQSNYLIPEQDLGTSETVKVPVAIIRGAHNIAGQGMFGFTMKRQDKTKEEDTKKDFTPSRRTSDWIPMSGSGVPFVTDNAETVKPHQTPIVTANEEYFPTSKIVRSPVGDIISGKIPQEFSPKNPANGNDGDIVRGKISFGRSSTSEMDKRKGSVVDVYPPSSSSVSKIGDTSNLVVSSVIKFS